jgi:glutamate synthase (NADPH/NADH) small chain
MGELGAFLKIDRAEALEREPSERVHDYREFVQPLPAAELARQGARCMECGVPFWHMSRESRSLQYGMRLL